jgi:tRNA A-37 threonylcarbamoyl transferase component Bud32
MAEWETLIAGQVHWQVRPDYRERLLGPQGLRLEEWLRNGQAKVLKKGSHRTLYRVQLDGLDFYIKHYPVPDLRSRLRQLVRPSKARHEFQQALAVATRGIPTFVPLAVGERPSLLGSGESYLISARLEDTEPLNDFIERISPGLAPGRQTRLRQVLATALGQFIARMHDAGVLHRDFHPGNLLVRLDAEDRPSLFLIDLHAVSLRASLPWRLCRENLIVLNRWFILRTSRSDRLRFWRAYFAARMGERLFRPCPKTEGGLSSPPEPAGWKTRTPVVLNQLFSALRAGLATELEARTRQSNFRFWRSFDRRCLQRNRHFHPIRSGRVVGHAAAVLDPDLLSQLGSDPDEPFRRPGMRLLKDSRSSTVAELEGVVAGVSRKLIYKRFRVSAWSDPLAALVRSPGALHSWLYGHCLRDRLLPTPRPLLVLHRRRRGLLFEGYLLTEMVEDAQELHQFLKGLERLSVCDARRRLRTCIDRLATVVRKMHDSRLSHRDLKAANLLVTADEVWFIDLVGIRRCRHLAFARKVQNLARLNASFHQCTSLSRADRLRFLRTYLQWGLFGRGSWKKWWRGIEQATGAKVARNQRVGRVLA